MKTSIRLPSRTWLQPLIRILNRQRFASPEEVERAELAFYVSYLRKGMIVFDVGAYIGTMTLLFSKLIGDKGQVYAFEASSPAFERLNVMCLTAGFSNIILNHMALAEEEGVRDFNVYDNQHLSWSSLAQRPLDKYGIHVKPVETEKVTTTTIDSYCQKYGITKIDLLKIDVEGAEYQVLLGAREMLEKKRIRCCVFEFGQTTFDMHNDPNQFEAYLKEIGYSVRNVVKGDPVFPGKASAKTARFSVHVAVPSQ